MVLFDIPVILAENGTTTKSYTVIVTRQSSGPQDNPGVIVNHHSLNLREGESAHFSMVLGTQPEDTVTVNVYGGDYLTLEPDILAFDINNWDISQSIKVDLAGGGVPHGIDKATVTGVVYSDDPCYNGITVTPVTVNFTDINVSGDANLNSLALSRGQMDPVFASGTTGYAVDVENSVNSITVTPATRDSGATVTVNGIPVASGNTSPHVDLNVGVNTIIVVVTAANGVDSKTYTITVTRAGGNEVVLDGGQDGEASLPSGATSLEVEDNSVVDLGAGVQSASGGSITVGGQSRSLDSYTGGDLGGVDLTTPQNVGGRSVRVEKAVRLKSGIEGQPVAITNTGLAGVSAVIPDGTTIMAPSGWDGVLTPPKAIRGTGTAPSGFSVGDTVIEVGSPNTMLLFDRPVTLTLQGVTGPVGYKPAGSNNWVPITRQAGGTYDNPTAPAFPGEAYITNGTDTKIITWHFTSFASLVAEPATPGDGSGGSSGGGANSANVANEVSKLIKAASGGELGLDGVIVHIPVGSSPADARFNIKELNAGEQNRIVSSEMRLKLCGSVYDITTTGSRNFGDNPITVKITCDPVNLAENQQPVIHYYDEGAGQWVALGTNIEYNEETQTYYAVTTVNHLTKFAVFTNEKEATETRIITLTIGQTSVTVEGKPYTLDAPPCIDEQAGRTLVPVRFVSEALGAVVEWNAEEQTVTITDNGKVITLTLDSQRVNLNGVDLSIDCAPAVLPPGRTFVPLRFISEALGAQVDYEAGAGSIIITR